MFQTLDEVPFKKKHKYFNWTTLYKINFLSDSNLYSEYFPQQYSDVLQSADSAAADQITKIISQLNLIIKSFFSSCFANSFFTIKGSIDGEQISSTDLLESFYFSLLLLPPCLIRQYCVFLLSLGKLMSLKKATNQNKLQEKFLLFLCLLCQCHPQGLAYPTVVVRVRCC